MRMVQKNKPYGCGLIHGMEQNQGLKPGMEQLK